LGARAPPAATACLSRCQPMVGLPALVPVATVSSPVGWPVRIRATVGVDLLPSWTWATATSRTASAHRPSGKDRKERRIHLSAEASGTFLASWWRVYVNPANKPFCR